MTHPKNLSILFVFSVFYLRSQLLSLLCHQSIGTTEELLSISRIHGDEPNGETCLHLTRAIRFREASDCYIS
ncbi:hypothetical protein IGI04_001306 [Brassica rapa subsp. trilocularis]|uniref:Secreted protein n=1 Tax=Brassica rapa subsp. trilocularis TaxID=1813537 RepID=A0ABQ7NSF2_BRACM|nr:hypothetical protein IGI04_001306 [Brassica rapa subsp. trilocularis]